MARMLLIADRRGKVFGSAKRGIDAAKIPFWAAMFS
jgi:hypothetical protein